MTPAFLRLSGRLSLWLASAALFLLMLLTFCDVVLRSVFNAPIEMAADLTRMLMAIMVFAVMPLVSLRGKQISVDLLDGAFRAKGLSRVRDVLVSLFCGVVLFWPASRVYDLAERSRSYGDRTEYLDLPVHYLEWFIAAMTLLTGIALIGRAVVLAVMPRLIGYRDNG